MEKGYWEDGYVQFFCKTNERRSPEINRGSIQINKLIYIQIDYNIPDMAFRVLCSCDEYSKPNNQISDNAIM